MCEASWVERERECVCVCKRECVNPAKGRYMRGNIIDLLERENDRKREREREEEVKGSVEQVVDRDEGVC